jgi:hypothetical protein
LDFTAEWKKYRAEKAEHNANKKSLRRFHAERKRAQAEKQEQELADIKSRNWRGKEIELELLLSVVASQHAKANKQLTDDLKHEYRAIPPFPDFTPWLEKEDPVRADQWRHRANATPEQWGAFIAPKQTDESLQTRDIRSFVAFIDKKRRLVEYRREGDHLPAFVDRGSLIDVRSCRDKAAMLAAMQLAAQKWGEVTVKGSPEFIEACVSLALKHNVKIANPELQSVIANEQMRIGKTRSTSNAQALPVRNLSTDVAQAPRVAVKDAAEAFERHREDILKSGRMGPFPNPSRLDWIIAIRMRATQYSQSEVEQILRSSAEKRPNDLRDCANYARKTANQVFGERGKREIEKFSAYRDEWLMLEGREAAHAGKAKQPRSRLPRYHGRE